jgi:hypothetical protein
MSLEEEIERYEGKMQELIRKERELYENVDIL